ncbi:hypothetical protein DACRYDRAFT_79701 [Dacryopinax primogenitus]|uniref:J domain-containing protein n=1 Tax=Dacryopinax primogenitus (strain DJM 731) TaxID=1858805 RepID=M5GCW3_DACPD|nr:uncharacterized protein DACRYDRAFT_79701 [Dacryopinax primogenitus]EJU02008.1 hypothetical protein DACRYDRAFT_79701 [Dacryopinax primogenitus]
MLAQVVRCKPLRTVRAPLPRVLSTFAILRQAHVLQLHHRHLSTTLTLFLPRDRHPTHLHNLLTNKYGFCPSCEAPYLLALPICAECGNIGVLPPRVNYFDLFELEKDPRRGAFDLDEKILKQMYLGMQKICHPDAWSTKSEEERKRAEDISSILNTAYSTLLTPLSRAQYILSQKGIDLMETDSLGQDHSEFLAQVLETRELLEGPLNFQELEAIRTRNDDRATYTVERLSQLFREGNWEQAREDAITLRYWQGIEDAVKERLSE